MKSVSLSHMSWLLGMALLLSSCASNKNRQRSLPELLVERLNWMDEVAAVKQARSLPITDPVREAELLRAMTQRGVAAGLNADNVRRFFTGQMQAAKEVQEEWLQQHRRVTSPAKAVPDLTQTVRPALDEIGRQMIALLAQSRSPSESAAILLEARQHLARADYSAVVMQPALAGLKAGLKKR
jgi:chorismate mutase-like protein